MPNSNQKPRANLVQALATRGLAFVDVAEADEALRKVISLKLRKLCFEAVGFALQADQPT